MRQDRLSLGNRDLVSALLFVLLDLLCLRRVKTVHAMAILLPSDLASEVLQTYALGGDFLGLLAKLRDCLQCLLVLSLIILEGDLDKLVEECGLLWIGSGSRVLGALDGRLGRLPSLT